ncbi:MAG: hypothetical protein EP298_00190 [Gammaproteobacteria bacterium]|nr:MAG: hypothetical protein EP298_00190 [Gammaproteobacteria bacterium]UTW41513.1 hypothetical protein KFE69_08310 [bacterium SCSIO 12844]
MNNENLANILDQLLESLSAKNIDSLMTFYEDNFVFELVPEHVAIEGKTAWNQGVIDFMNWVQAGKKEVLRYCVDGRTVWVERVDHWQIDNQWIALPIVAIVEFSDANKVQKWREYHTLEYRKQFENFPKTGLVED